MTEVTPEQQALHALDRNLPRGDLSMAAQLEYDRLRPAWERGEVRPAAGELEAARLAWVREHSHQQRGRWPVTGDEVRDTTFLIVPGGRDVAQVDDLLRRVAAEIDAGRPVEPVIDSESATLRPQKYGYDVEAIDWFLETLRLAHRDRAGMSQDPWRGLAVAAQLSRSESGHLAGADTRSARTALRNYYAGECRKAWRDFDELPGVHLRLEWTGMARRELRTEEQQTIACRRWAWRPVYSVRGRSFAVRGNKLLDEAKIPILYVRGKHFNWVAGAEIRIPDQGRLRFPVRATDGANAVMTAVDEAGNRVARYRHPRNGPIEIIVHPDWELTDQRALALAISAPWLSSYFNTPGG
jgi:hypothetical protein